MAATARKRSARSAASQRATLTKKLRAQVKRLGEAENLVNEITLELFTGCYAWVQLAHEDGRAVGSAITTLASTLSVSRSRVESWYLCGKYAAENDIPDTSDHRSVRAASNNSRMLSRASKLRINAMIKKGEPYKVVRRAIRQDRGVASVRADRQVENLYQHGELNEKSVRMQAMVCKTYADRFYGNPCKVLIVDSSGKTRVEID